MDTIMADDAAILTRIEGFCKQHKMSPTKFGRRALGDGNLVSNLKAGRSLTLKTARRVMDFMATYRPGAEQAAA